MANVPITSLPILIAPTGTEYMEVVQDTTPLGSSRTYVSKRATTQSVANTFLNNLPGRIEWVLDGHGAGIVAGTYGYLEVPFAATITGATMLADAVATATVDIWRCSYAQFDGGVTHPSAGDSICGGAPPTISAAAKSSDTTLTTWTTTLSAGDVLAFHVNSDTTATQITVALTLARTL